PILTVATPLIPEPLASVTAALNCRSWESSSLLANARPMIETDRANPRNINRLLFFIFFPRWILHPKRVGLDGEEIETVLKLKGSSLRRAHGDSCGILPPVKGTRPARGRNSF